MTEGGGENETTSRDGWRPLIAADGGPLYLQIVTAIEQAARDGRLGAGDRLPPQRTLAKELGVDLTTVTRAYQEARRRRLIDAVTGRGSFVTAPREPAGPAIDLSMNVPPPPRGVRLGELIARGVADIVARTSADTLMSYHSGPGDPVDRAAGALWLAPALGRLDPERLLIAPGAQAALAGVLSLAAGRGETVLTDPLAYPGLISAAERFGVALSVVDGDADGMRPDALDEAAGTHGSRLVYLAPTINNPTTATMPEGRRREIAAVAGRRGLAIIEDDPYSLLARDAPPAFATIAPDRTWHVATVSKTLTPGLRTAYVIAPDEARRLALTRALNALAQMPAPLTTALLTFWIRDGAAAEILAGVREEAAARQAIARAILPDTAKAHPDGLHVWLPLEAGDAVHRLLNAARAHGLGVAPADAFLVSGQAPEAVRISLGAVATRARLEEALKVLAALLADGWARRRQQVV